MAFPLDSPAADTVGSPSEISLRHGAPTHQGVVQGFCSELDFTLHGSVHVLVGDAARALGLELIVLNATNDEEIDQAFATLVQRQAGALVISSDPFFGTRLDKLATNRTSGLEKF